MITRIATLCCITAVLCSIQLHGQRIPVGALPVQYNGGFAGEAGALRVASYSYFSYVHPESSFRSRWDERVGSYISADHFLKKIRSGIALTLGRQGNGDHFNNNSMALAISPKFSFKGKYTFAPFANATISQTKSKNVEIVDPNTFQPGMQPEIILIEDYRFNDVVVKTGFLLNSNKAYVGLSAEVFQDIKSPVYTKRRFLSEMKYTLQAGYAFQRTPESNFSFTPQLVISYNRYNLRGFGVKPDRKMHGFTLMDFNLAFRYKKFISGINNTGLMLGYQTNRFKLQVTNFYWNEVRQSVGFDFSDNSYLMLRPIENAQNKYSGNISLRYILKKNYSGKMQGF